jgi:hypothetical protein
MIECPRCGGSLGESLVCTGCLYAFSEPVIVELYRQSVLCPDCGAENHNFTKFCHRCRVQLHSDEQLDALNSRVLLRSLRERAYQAALTKHGDVTGELDQYITTFEKSETARQGIQQQNAGEGDEEMLVRQLAQKGVTVSCHCWDCGTRLTIGSPSPEIPNHCPQCGARLDVIDFSKLIRNALLANSRGTSSERDTLDSLDRRFYS